MQTHAGHSIAFNMFLHFVTCDLDLWPFDLILNVVRTHDGWTISVASLVIVVSVVLVLSCEQTESQIHMDCTVEIDGLLVIDGSVDGRTAQFWRYRPWSSCSCHTARLRHDCRVAHRTCGLHACVQRFKSCHTGFFELFNRLMTLRTPRWSVQCGAV